MPSQSEAPANPQLNPYARFLDQRSLDTVLSETPATLARLAEALGPSRLAQPPAPGKWSPAQILCHLADCEIAFAFRLRQTLSEDSPTLQPFDQDRWAAPYSAISAGQALAAFTAMREWNLILIRNAPPEAPTRPAIHPERGTMTYQTIVETMAGHDINHIHQLQKLAGGIHQ